MNYSASLISYLTLYQLSFPNAFIGNLFESALTAGFPLKRFAGMTEGLFRYETTQFEIAQPHLREI
jgi:hypothetical protein